VWKQAPFVTLLVAGAMASIDRQHIEAARNLGAPRWRVLWDIVLPQVRGTVLVGVVLSFVTMLSVLSVPLMINPNSPTMITVDVAYRINTHSDYAVANALCLLSLLVAAGGAAFYLRHAVKSAEGRRERRGSEGAIEHRNQRACRSAARALRVRDLRAPHQPAAVGVRRKVVLPEQAPLRVRVHVLAARFQSTRRGARFSRHQRVDRRAHRRRQPRRRDSRGLRARAAASSVSRRDLLLFLLPQRCRTCRST
jgi:hypothetical protein